MAAEHKSFVFAMPPMMVSKKTKLPVPRLKEEVEALSAELSAKYAKFQPKLRFRDVYASLDAFEVKMRANVQEVDRVEETKEMDDSFMDKRRAVWQRLNSLPKVYVAVDEICELPAAEKYVGLDGLYSVRPVRDDEVKHHMQEMKTSGFLGVSQVVLCTPGPNGFKYGIIDGQHRIVGIQRMYAEASKSKDVAKGCYGAALESLSRPDSDVPHVPAVVLENLTPEDGILFGLVLNGMYKHGDSNSAFHWMNLCIKFNDWSLFPGSKMFNIFMWGTKSGTQLQDAKSCLESIVRFGIDTKSLFEGKKLFQECFRSAARLYFMSLHLDLECELYDPHKKKDTLQGFRGFGVSGFRG
ncbi:hypothetical protein B5M09_005973 [Aphanomyces astaci]|uniref:Uncharacterized protein n=1 Tax=Aphanomyces astaci TaxID=112090 RepID=A0A3R7ZFQ6_APHAT|nr:hypothetical protein B5M09_005973 [Aphanomyces astaci]